MINGFGAPTPAGACPATPGATTPNSNFFTEERATTTGCIYATLSQIRTLTVAKTVVGTPPASQAFGFNSTSSLTGSPWAAPAFNLATGQSVTRDLLQGETVSVTETIPAGDQWALTSLVCTDGTGRTLGTADGVTTNPTSGLVTLANTPAPATAAAGPITCRYTNTYTPRATLTLVKTITGGTATLENFTLSAGGGTPISGISGTAAVTNRRVAVGTYTLTESTTVAGYVPGNWSCTSGTLNGNQLILSDGQNATCTINNRYATGNFRISKVISGPAGGFTGNAATAFTGTYVCANGTSGSFSVSTGTPWISPQIPAGVTCTVTENQPTGNLADASYVWAAPAYTPTNGQVTMADGATQSVTITNTFTRRVGSVQIGKLVAPRPAPTRPATPAERLASSRSPTPAGSAPTSLPPAPST